MFSNESKKKLIVGALSIAILQNCLWFMNAIIQLVGVMFLENPIGYITHDFVARDIYCYGWHQHAIWYTTCTEL